MDRLNLSISIDSETAKENKLELKTIFQKAPLLLDLYLEIN